MGSKKSDEILKAIGWKGGYAEDFQEVERISDSNKVSNLVILTLTTIFSTATVLFNFLSFLLPTDMTLPDFKRFCTILDRVKKTKLRVSKKKSSGPLDEFLAKPFFLRSEPSPVDHTANCHHEPELKKLRLQTKTLEQESVLRSKITELLDKEREKNWILLSEVEHLSSKLSLCKKQIAGYASGSARRLNVSAQIRSPPVVAKQFQCEKDSCQIHVTKQFDDSRFFLGEIYEGSQKKSR